MKKSNLDLSKAIRAEQSSRTTFKLSANASEALEDLCKTFNLTPKHILKVIFAYKNIVDEAVKQAKSIKGVSDAKSIRKTVVISKDMHLSLNKIVKETKVSRDNLLSALIIKFKEFFKHQIEEEKELEKKAQNIISDFSNHLLKVEDNLKSLLSNDHPITQRFGYIAVLTFNLLSAIDSKLEENIPIDPEDFSQSC